MTCTCGAPALRIELAKDDAVIDVVYLCERCLAEAHEGLEVWHVQFRALLAAGCPRDKANDIIIARMREVAPS